MNIHLMRPEWLWAALPAVLFCALLWRERRARGNWQSVISPELLPFLMGEHAGEKNRNYLPLLLLAWLLAVFAAAGPSWKKIPQPIHQKQDALVVLLDLSYSMKSADLPPSRIDRARQKLLDLLASRREGQTGLIAFAGDSHIVTPLTDDTQTIANLLPALHPDMMPVPGSDPVGAVEQGLDLLHSAGIRRGNMLLVTDSLSEGDVTQLSRALKGKGVSLGIMGVGTQTGAPIPLPGGGFLKDRKGAIVMPGLEESTLRELAGASGGRYRRMAIDDSDLDYLLAPPAVTLEQETLALDREADTWQDQGYLLVLPLLPLVLLLFRRGWLVSLLPLLLLSPSDASYAQGWDDLWLNRDQQGQRALAQGEAAQAEQLFEHPGWAGTAAYEDGNFEASAEHFGATYDADSLYNLGNALARAGRIDEAIDAYQQSLQMQPEQIDASENLALLEQLKQQQESQQNQQSGEQSEQDEQNPSDSDDQQQGQGSGESGANQDKQGQQQNGQSEQQDQSPQDSQQQAQNSDASSEQGSSESQSQTGQDSDEQAQAEAAQASQADASEQAEQSEDGDQGQALAQNQPQGQEQEQQERDQAMEQWLRRVPDDPSGLLREKFRHESQMRREQGTRKDNEQYW